MVNGNILLIYLVIIAATHIINMVVATDITLQNSTTFP